MTSQEEPQKPAIQEIMPTPVKPALPALPEELVSKKPTHTGICPGKAKVLMFLAALPISLVVGIAAHFVGIAVAFVGSWIAVLPTLLTSVCGFVSWLFVLVGLAIIFGVYVGYPFVVGMLNGSLVAGLGKKGFCRNPKTAGWAAVLNGIPLYLGHALMSVLVSKQMGIMTFTPAQLESSFDIDMATGGGSVLTYILCAVEFAFLLWGSFTGAKDEVQNSTFCEVHQAWYGNWVNARYPVSMIGLLEQRLTGAVPLYPVDRVKDEVFPALVLGYRRCPASEDCDMEVHAILWWQETTTDKKGQAKTENKSEVWFDALLPSDLGCAMVAELDLKPQDKKKKK